MTIKSFVKIDLGNREEIMVRI